MGLTHGPRPRPGLQVVRKGGLRSTLLYNLTGGDWEVLVMNAMIGEQTAHVCRSWVA